LRATGVKASLSLSLCNSALANGRISNRLLAFLHTGVGTAGPQWPLVVSTLCLSIASYLEAHDTHTRIVIVCCELEERVWCDCCPLALPLSYVRLLAPSSRLRTTGIVRGVWKNGGEELLSSSPLPTSDSSPSPSCPPHLLLAAPSAMMSIYPLLCLFSLSEAFSSVSLLSIVSIPSPLLFLIFSEPVNCAGAGDGSQSVVHPFRMELCVMASVTFMSLMSL